MSFIITDLIVAIMTRKAMIVVAIFMLLLMIDEDEFEGKEKDCSELVVFSFSLGVRHDVSV